MILSERHIIKQSNQYYKDLDNLCYLSKNLYNSALYAIRQHYFNTKQYLNKFELINQFTKNKQLDYISLPRKVSQQIIYQVDQNFKSFFNSLKSNNINHKISIPKYLDKSGKYEVIYTNQAISSKLLKQNILQLSGLKEFNLPIIHNNVKQARLIHKGNHIVIEILYEVREKEYVNNNRYCSIDLGINNLCTIGSNVIKPIIINGKPLKSINQYYNKKLAYLKSEQDLRKNKQYNKKKIQHLIFKRNNKINDYLHKSSKYIVNHLVSNNITNLVIGLNKEWKQETNIGRVNNQNFVQIPHTKLIEQLKYKCQLEGIKVIVREESYTSKCSFIDNEEICKHENYLGKRIYRGLYVSKEKRILNADLNGALNILRKEVPELQYGIEVCSTPMVHTIKK